MLFLEKNEEDDENADQDVDIHLAEISLSPYNIQDYEDCGEDQIEKLPLHGPIADFVREFVDIHFKPEPFIKRKRDKARVERDQIGGADPRLKTRGHSFKISSAKNIVIEVSPVRIFVLLHAVMFADLIKKK